MNYVVGTIPVATSRCNRYGRYERGGARDCLFATIALNLAHVLVCTRSVQTFFFFRLFFVHSCPSSYVSILS